MRLLLTTDTVGGVWTFTRELTQQLLARGHAVALVSFGRRPAPEQSVWSSALSAEYHEAFHFRASDVPLEWMQENATAYSGGVQLLLETAREFRADLLHSSQFCWGALPGDLPRIITAHSDVLSWAAACHPEGLPDSSWLAHYRQLVQSGLNCTDVLIAPTAWMRHVLTENFRVSCPISVVHNGRTIPATSTTIQRKLQAVSAGRLWDKAKGMQTLLEVQAPIPILIAGEQSFEHASADLGLLQAVGLLDEIQLFELFRASSIYIVTSIYEPFGLAPYEAALCGCAIVARDIPSLREVWGDAALFYKTPGELAAILRELKSDPALLRGRQREAGMRAAEFPADRMASDYLALYESLLTRKRASSAYAQEPATHAA